MLSIFGWWMQLAIVMISAMGIGHHFKNHYCAGIFNVVLCLLQDLLTKHKIMCAQFLENNYDKVREK